jgi:hypothetical protein
MTGYFVASEEVKWRLMDKGVEASRIHITGIPVMPAFRMRPRREECAAEFGLAGAEIDPGLDGMGLDEPVDGGVSDSFGETPAAVPTPGADEVPFDVDTPIADAEAAADPDDPFAMPVDAGQMFTAPGAEAEVDTEFDATPPPPAVNPTRPAPAPNPPRQAPAVRPVTPVPAARPPVVTADPNAVKASQSAMAVAKARAAARQAPAPKAG